MSSPEGEAGVPGSEPGPILVVAALGREIMALTRLLARSRRESIGHLRLPRGELSGRDVMALVTGDGAMAAERGLSFVLERRRVAAVLGMGIAGGLSPDLTAGDLVLAGRVEDSAGTAFEPPRWRWSDRATEVVRRRGSVLSADEIAGPAHEKRRLWQRLGSPVNAVVDLESATWARLAAASGLPWLILRAVSDTAEEDLPLDFNRFRGADGRVRGSKVFAHALAHPSLMKPLRELFSRVGPCGERLAAGVREILAW